MFENQFAATVTFSYSRPTALLAVSPPACVLPTRRHASELSRSSGNTHQRETSSSVQRRVVSRPRSRRVVVARRAVCV